TPPAPAPSAAATAAPAGAPAPAAPDAPTAAPPGSPPPPAAKPISGFSLMARVIWDAIRRLFGGRSEPRISLPPTRSALRRTQTRSGARAASEGGPLKPGYGHATAMLS